MAQQTRDMKKVGAGVGLLAAAGAAAAYYFFGSKDADKHRKKTARWALDLKKEVVRKASKLKYIDRDSIIGVVDDVARAYENVRGLSKEEILKAAHELRTHWRALEGELHDDGIKVVSVVAKKTAAKRSKVKKLPRAKAKRSSIVFPAIRF